MHMYGIRGSYENSLMYQIATSEPLWSHAFLKTSRETVIDCVIVVLRLRLAATIGAVVSEPHGSNRQQSYCTQACSTKISGAAVRRSSLETVSQACSKEGRKGSLHRCFSDRCAGTPKCRTQPAWKVHKIRELLNSETHVRRCGDVHNRNAAKPTRNKAP